MVIGGSFEHIDEARAEAYYAIQRKPKMVIEIFNFTGYTGGSPILGVGIVMISKGQIIYIDSHNTKYILKKDGKIRRL